jgi:hypothetical protein
MKHLLKALENTANEYNIIIPVQIVNDIIRLIEDEDIKDFRNIVLQTDPETHIVTSASDRYSSDLKNRYRIHGCSKPKDYTNEIKELKEKLEKFEKVIEALKNI